VRRAQFTGGRVAGSNPFHQIGVGPRIEEVSSRPVDRMPQSGDRYTQLFVTEVWLTRRRNLALWTDRTVTEILVVRGGGTMPQYWSEPSPLTGEALITGSELEANLIFHHGHR
jgi:hypothetical protein